MVSKVNKKFLGGKTEIVIPHYEDFLEEKGVHLRDSRGYLYFHPSAFGGCIRKMAFQFHSENDDRFKTKEPIDIKFMRICDTGHAFHDRMQRDLSIMGLLRGWWKCRSCGETIGKEEPLGIFLPETCKCMAKKKDDKRKGIKLFEYEEIYLISDPKYNFRGNCDGIVELERGNPESRYIIDFKSINEGGFSYLRKPDKKYIMQVMIYMWLSGVKKSIIYYEDKNKHQLAEFEVPYDEGLVDYIKTSSRKLKKICNLGKIPKIHKDYKNDKKPCFAYSKKCEYYDFCYGDRI